MAISSSTAATAAGTRRSASLITVSTSRVDIRSRSALSGLRRSVGAPTRTTGRGRTVPARFVRLTATGRHARLRLPPTRCDRTASAVASSALRARARLRAATPTKRQSTTVSWASRLAIAPER